MHVFASNGSFTEAIWKKLSLLKAHMDRGIGDMLENLGINKQ